MGQHERMRRFLSTLDDPVRDATGAQMLEPKQVLPAGHVVSRTGLLAVDVLR